VNVQFSELNVCKIEKTSARVENAPYAWFRQHKRRHNVTARVNAKMGLSQPPTSRIRQLNMPDEKGIQMRDIPALDDRGSKPPVEHFAAGRKYTEARKMNTSVIKHVS